MNGKMWFGTAERSEWIPAPLSGADVSPQGMTNSGTLLDGGGFVNPRFGNHKMYQFSWSDANALSVAQLMRAYASGLYGRGLLYPVDPMTYHTNVLPLQWSAPFLTIPGYGDFPPLYRTRRVATVARPESTANNLPAYSAEYQITSTHPVGYPGDSNSLYINVPQGMRLRLGAIYTAEQPNLGVWWAYGAGTGAAYKATPLVGDEANIVPHTTVPGAPVRIWIGTAPGAMDSTRQGWLRVQAIIARLEAVDSPWQAPIPFTAAGPWVPGEGNSGCRPDGFPTITYTSAVGDGQAGLAMTLRETGSWEL